MTFRVVVVFFSRTAKLVTLANVIAEGARAVSGAEVRDRRSFIALNTARERRAR